MKHDTFIFRKSWYDAIEDLPDSMQLKILKAIIQLGTTKEVDLSVLSDYEQGIFKVIGADIDKMNANYEQIITKQSEGGKKGMKSRWYKSDNSDNLDNSTYDTITPITQVINDKLDNSDNSNTHTHNITTNSRIESNNTDSSSNTTNAHARARKGGKKYDEVIPVEDRRIEFGKSLEQYLSQYPRKMLNKFYLHWAEIDKTGKKMRWEKEATWELPMRLAKWAANNYGDNGFEPAEEKSRIEQLSEAAAGAKRILKKMTTSIGADAPRLNS